MVGDGPPDRRRGPPVRGDRAGSGSGPDRDRGQLLLTAAIVLAFVLVGLVAVLNSFLFAENVATRGPLAATDDAERLTQITDRDVDTIFTEIAGDRPYVPQPALEENLTTYSRAMSRSLARDGPSYVEYSLNVTDSKTGALIVDSAANSTGDEFLSGNDDPEWTLATNVTETPEFFVRFDELRKGQDKFNTSGFMINFTSDSDRWLVRAYEDNPADEYVIQTGNTTGRNTVCRMPDTVDNITVRKVGSFIEVEPCGDRSPFLTGVNGEYEVRFDENPVGEASADPANGELSGNYRIAVNGPAVDTNFRNDTEPNLTSLIFEPSVDLVYQSPELSYTVTEVVENPLPRGPDLFTLFWRDPAEVPGPGTETCAASGCPRLRLVSQTSPATSGFELTYSVDRVDIVTRDPRTRTTGPGGEARVLVTPAGVGDGEVSVRSKESRAQIRYDPLVLTGFEGAEELTDVPWSANSGPEVREEDNTTNLDLGGRQSVLVGTYESDHTSSRRVTSDKVDTSEYSLIVADFKTQEGGANDDPESTADESLVVEYRAANGSWVEAKRIIAGDEEVARSGHRIRLAGDAARHKDFRLRFSQPTSTYTDAWFVDDVEVVGVGEADDGSMTVDSATWSTTADWDAAPADLSASVVHEDLVIDTDGDDTSKLSDQVYLGYPTTGRWDRDPVVYYRFDRIISNGGEQEVEDASGNDHDAVARYVDADGAEGTEVGGIAGTGSFAFDGAGDYVFSKDPASYLNGEDAITVSMWVKPLSSASEESLFFETGADDEGDDEPGPISLTRDKKGGGSLRGDLSANKTTKGVSVADGDQRSGRWRHLVIAWSDTDPLELHLNGRQIASSNKEARGVISNVTDFRIGGDDDLFGRDFTGKIDAVRIYDEELTDEEIDDLYNVSNRGVLVTAGKNLSSAVTGDDLQLETAAAVPSGTAVTVYVETDPDGDGVYEGTSSAIRLDDGTNVYDVQDLPTASERFRVRMVLETTDPTKTPIVGGVRLDSS